MEERFYYAALGANVPILPGYLDFKKKEGGFGAPIYLTGNKTDDLAKIKAFYEGMTAKYPEKFNLDAIRIDWTKSYVYC